LHVIIWPQRENPITTPAGWRAAVFAGTYLAGAMSAAMLLGTLLNNLFGVRSALPQLGMAYLLPLAAFWLLLALLQKRLELRAAAKLTLANILWAVSVHLGSSLVQAWNMTPATLTPVPGGSSLSGDCRLASSAAAHEPAAPAWLDPLAPPGSKRHYGAREKMGFKQVGRCSHKPELPAGAARAGLCRRTIERHVPG